MSQTRISLLQNRQHETLGKREKNEYVHRTTAESLALHTLSELSGAELSLKLIFIPTDM